ncbi:MAG TPA: hypothetical protein VF559_12365 [Caulobacteraceae bacterium]
MTPFALRRPFLLAAGAALALALPSLAADPPAKRAGVFQKMLDCRAVTDSAERLACYDQAAAQFEQAETQGQVVVVDRAQMREVRRQVFGFNVPSMSLFTRGEKEEEVNNLSTTVTAARQDPYGKWVITIEGGAVWKQTEVVELVRRPKPGSKVEIRSGALGSFFMNVDGQRAVKVERVK